MGMHWVTQRGFKRAETMALADAIADILEATTPYYQGASKDSDLRAKVDFAIFEKAKSKISALAENAGIDFKATHRGYPHFYNLEDRFEGDWVVFAIGGERVRQFLNMVLSSDLDGLGAGQSQPTRLYTPGEEIDGVVACLAPHEYRLCVPAEKGGLAAAWLRDLSDGYIWFDDDLLRKVPGPVWVQKTTDNPCPKMESDPIGKHKPYFIGISNYDGDGLPEFRWEERESELRRTPVYDLHVELGGRMVPFAGWEMPVVYTSILDEHLAVRNAAGLFDVAHMGVYQAEGPNAAVFLDSVCGNDISALAVGESLYTHFLTPNAEVIDDLLVYRRSPEKYLVVVNASNDDKDWAWLKAVRNGDVRVDNARPWAQAFGRDVILRNLRDPKEGGEMRVDLALQGPRSRDILLALGVDDENRKKIMRLLRTNLCEARVGNPLTNSGQSFDLIVSRTGYTGEKMAFELFVHPDQAQDMFRALLKVGEPFGLKPIGLGARDSLRTEAGLPLYGHEMGGELGLGVAEAGFSSYVKTYKPWFIGRDAYLAREAKRKGVVVRFRFNETGVRMAHPGDPVMDRRGKVIGTVTSCAADKEGYLLGQAFIELKFAKEGTPIYIFQGAPTKANKAPAELGMGDRVTMPTVATVLRRFPK
jgi:glycine hydroxymethyltransferase